MAIAFEGDTVTGAIPAFGENSGTLSLTTSGTDRIILACVATTLPSGGGVPATLSTIVDSNGLTWTKRTSHSWLNSAGDQIYNIELWWAYAHAQQTSNSVVATFSAACGYAYALIAVSGVQSSAWAQPFDTDASLPSLTVNLSSPTTAPTATVSTQGANVGVVSAWCNFSNMAEPASAGAWTDMWHFNFIGQVIFHGLHKSFTGAQASVTPDWAGSSTSDYGLLIDAIHDAPSVVAVEGPAALALFGF